MDGQFSEDYREVSCETVTPRGDMAVWPPGADPEDAGTWYLFDAEEWRSALRAPHLWSQGSLR